MKRKLFTIIISLAIILNINANSIGTWKNYLAYSEITDVQQGGNMLYVLASNALYTYNTNDQSIQTYDKTNGLNDCVINMIAWCQSAKKLVIVYNSGNIDIMDEKGNVTNLPDYYSKTLTYDKTVYGIDIIDNYAYLSTGFGIVIVDVNNVLISNSYILGFQVDYCYISNNKIYAASSTNGIYSANVSDNLLDPASWSYETSYITKTKTIDPDLLEIAQSLKPGGPDKNWFYFIKYDQDRLYTAGGLYDPGKLQELNRNGTIQILDNDEWIICDDDISAADGYNFKDVDCIAVDPKNPNHFFAGARTGMYEYEDFKMINYFNRDNSPLQTATDDGITEHSNNHLLILSLMFDDDGSLWILNSQCKSNSIVEYTSNNEFIMHDNDELMYGGIGLAGLKGLMKDSQGLLWFVNDNHLYPSFYCYQPSTDTVLSFIPKQNQDGTSLGIYDVSCVAEDINGNIWAGTDTGPIVLYASDITSNSPEYNQIKVPRNDGTNYADYLLSSIEILSIAVDGAGRKWFGTNGNGVYLISEDNMTQLQHFIAAETPLLSDVIYSISINNESGEVFFGTDNGLCSYVSDATEPNEEMTKDNVYAYPNPVKPEYTGLITITGLSLNSDVKIVSSNGTLIAEGKSNGGTFTWDGCDYNGKKVVSGVYIVLTATSEGKKGTACKIAIIR